MIAAKVILAGFDDMVGRMAHRLKAACDPVPPRRSVRNPGQRASEGHRYRLTSARGAHAAGSGNEVVRIKKQRCTCLIDMLTLHDEAPWRRRTFSPASRDTMIERKFGGP